MTGSLLLLALGFGLGLRHATDSDHVVAVTTIVTREKRIGKAAFIGALWGIGHTATLVAVGLPIVLFGLVVPVRLSQSLELSVAFMLMLLGVLNLAEYFRRMHALRRPAAAHGEGESHGHEPAGLGARQLLRPLAIGIVHGLAGSAAVALLVLNETREPLLALLYLVLFGVGTIAGMACVTALVAAPIALASARSRALVPHFGWISGLLSLGFGVFLVYQIGFVDGLLLSRP